MEKENKYIRTDIRKEYTKTIKRLVEVIRKQDPRYKQYLIEVEMEELRKSAHKSLK
jgi:hypothetical protein